MQQHGNIFHHFCYFQTQVLFGVVNPDEPFKIHAFDFDFDGLIVGFPSYLQNHFI